MESGYACVCVCVAAFLSDQESLLRWKDRSLHTLLSVCGLLIIWFAHVCVFHDQYRPCCFWNLCICQSQRTVFGIVINFALHGRELLNIT